MNNQDKILLNLLERAGFAKKEAMVYLALLELGQGSVGEIAKITELKRPIVYVVIESLIKRGCVGEVLNKKINTFHAVDPSIISSQLNNTAKDFSEMVAIMNTLANKGKKKPNIAYYDTKEGVWNAYNEVNSYKEAFFVTSFSRIEKFFPGAIEGWKNGYQKKHNKLISRTLVPPDERNINIAKEFIKITNKAEIKMITGLQDYNLDLAVYENKVSITSFTESPFLLLITSEELAKMMRTFFDIAWEGAKKIG